MVSLATPLLLLLLPLPLILTRLLPPRRGEDPALVAPEATVSWFAAHRPPAPRRRARLRAALPWVAWLCLVTALSGPRLVVPTAALPVTGRDLVLALDLSGSMVREDFFLEGQEISRLDAVKRVAGDFVRGRGGDRVGLVIFGSDAYVAAPLSYDVESIADQVEEAVIGISGRATNIGDGLGLAMKRLEASEAASKVVVLLSDGVNNAGAARPRDVAQLAAGMGIRIHTIALGPKDLTTAEEGERGVVDAGTLRAMAEMSGGESFRVRNLEDLEAMAAALDRLEATDRAGVPAEIYRALWIWPALVALACLVAMPLAGALPSVGAWPGRLLQRRSGGAPVRSPATAERTG
ncbi:VWA domain-containing protein [Marinibacterium profundimaris]|uniref:VWA domain-containing protein n=1 Tax=Marinibacterium profundimaris TaxID=1679460 RepID=UPI000B521F90|nr:VWA domain-containing protein [Marinibacterium profundimaris]